MWWRPGDLFVLLSRRGTLLVMASRRLTDICKDEEIQ